MGGEPGRRGREVAELPEVDGSVPGSGSDPSFIGTEAAGGAPIGETIEGFDEGAGATVDEVKFVALRGEGKVVGGGGSNSEFTLGGNFGESFGAFETPAVDFLVVTSGEEGEAVGGKGDGSHGRLVFGVGGEKFPVLNVEEFGGFVSTSGSETRSVLVDCEGVDGIGVAGEILLFLTGFPIQNAERVVGTRDGEPITVWAG